MKNSPEWATPGYGEEVKKWSQIVRKFRKVLGLTQGEFSRKIGVSYFSVNKYENERALPAGVVRGMIRGLFKRTFSGIEPEDVIEMDDLELKKLFIKEVEKKGRKPKIILRPRSPEIAPQTEKRNKNKG